LHVARAAGASWAAESSLRGDCELYFAFTEFECGVAVAVEVKEPELHDKARNTFSPTTKNDLERETARLP